MTKLTIAASNLNMPRLSAVLGGMTAHEKFLEEAGYCPGFEINTSCFAYRGGGFEWSEVRNPRNILAPRMALGLAAKGRISSLHQSWRSTTATEIAARFFNPKGEWNGKPNNPKNVLKSLGLVATIPFINSWRDRLISVQAAAGKLLPVVAHPNEQQPPSTPARFKFDYPKLAKDFKVLRHQPTVETLQAWGVLSANMSRTIQGMVAVQPKYGFKEVAVDTKHFFAKRHGLRLSDPLEASNLLASYDELTEVQLNLTGDPKTLSQILSNGLQGTYHGAMLLAMFSTFPTDKEVTLVTEVTQEDFNNIGMQNITKGNRRVIEAVLDLTENAAA